MKTISRKKESTGPQTSSPFFNKNRSRGDVAETSTNFFQPPAIQAKCAACEAAGPGKEKQEGMVQKKENGNSGKVASAGKNISSTNGEPVIQRDDAAFETGGLGPAIASGTMVPDGMMGQTFYAENCRGLFGCRVGFTFEKAYTGTYFYNAAGRDVKGVYVKIASDYDHNICGDCFSIRLIQTVRNTIRGTTGDIESAEPDNPTRRERSGWGSPGARSEGWRVDTLSDLTNPFYDSDPDFDTQIGSVVDPAILWDAPADWDTDTNMGKEFQTFFVCESAIGDKKTIAGVNWGYYINAGGDVNFLPATPIPFCGASEELQDASNRWDNITGNDPVNIDFAGETGESHEGDSTMLWFNLDSTALRTDASINSNIHYGIALRRIRQHIMATPLPRIIVHGYSSKDGDPAHNMDLSRQRAEAVRAKLLADGIPNWMIDVQAHGVTNDLSPQDLNRRVEIETTHLAMPFPFFP